MTSPGGPHAETRRMMETAIRRLNALEYVILAVAMALALAAGALAAWILQGTVGAAFRISWIVSSLLFFGVPGLLVLRRERRAEGLKGAREAVGESTSKGDDG